MAVTLGELKGKVLRLLNKTASNPGFYTDAKISDAIEEAMDYVAVEMFLADEGWQKKQWPLDTESGQISLDLPEDLAMIDWVGYKIGDTYVEMIYDQGNKGGQLTTDTAARQDGYVYGILDNALYFNPPLAEGNTAGILIRGQAFPQRLLDDQDFIEAHFNKAMQHFIKYKTASILASSVEKSSRPWAPEEAQWYGQMQAMIVQRNKQSQPIRDFDP